VGPRGFEVLLDATEFLIQFLRTQKLKAILLAPKLKRPPERQFPTTADLSEILEHLDQGGNIGILGGPIAILDFDDMSLLTEMYMKLGPLQLTVLSARGGRHCYVRTQGLPARIKWKSQLVGEIQRGEKQYVVAPPSIFDDKPYKWLQEDPERPIPELPERWRQYLLEEMTPEVPEEFRKFIGEGMPQESWQGPDAETLIRRALDQPGAVRRQHGVKFQCPGCAAEGHDRHRDNATVFNDGRWGCAYDPNHKRQIAQVIADPSVLPTLKGEPIE